MSSNGRLLELDGIRGIAILMVLVWHYFTGQLRVPHDSALYQIQIATHLCWSGVDLFFVLSGFLISGILLDHIDAANYYSVFYRRRALRILPPYWVLLCGFLAFAAISPAGYEWLYAWPLPNWSYWTFSQNFVMGVRQTWGPAWLGVTWSLAVEEQFYLVIPPLLRLLRGKLRVSVLLVLIVAAPLFRAGADTRLWATVNPFARADSLLLGTLLAIAMRDPRCLAAMQRHRNLLFGALLVGLAGAVALIYKMNQPGRVLNHSWLSLTYLLLILVVLLHRGSKVASITRSRTLVWFGQRSYGLYLYHSVICSLLHGLFFHRSPQIDGVATAAVTLAAMFVSMLAAEVSFRVLERPLQKVGQGLRYRIGTGTCDREEGDVACAPKQVAQ